MRFYQKVFMWPRKDMHHLSSKSWTSFLFASLTLLPHPSFPSRVPLSLGPYTHQQIQSDGHFRLSISLWDFHLLKCRDWTFPPQELPLFMLVYNSKKRLCTPFQHRPHPSISWLCTSPALWLSPSSLDFSTWTGARAAPHLLSRPFLPLCDWHWQPLDLVFCTIHTDAIIL